MITYGMENMTLLVQAPGLFGNLQYFPKRDRDMVLPYPEFELLENFGEGEVINPSSSPSPQLVKTAKDKSMVVSPEQQVLLQTIAVKENTN